MSLVMHYDNGPERTLLGYSEDCIRRTLKRLEPAIAERILIIYLDPEDCDHPSLREMG